MLHCCLDTLGKKCWPVLLFLEGSETKPAQRGSCGLDFTAKTLVRPSKRWQNNIQPGHPQPEEADVSDPRPVQHSVDFSVPSWYLLCSSVTLVVKHAHVLVFFWGGR